MRKLLYKMPLSPEDRQEMCEVWCDLNQATYESMVETALSLHNRGKRISIQYLIEKERYEGDHPLVAVPFLDTYGGSHKYKINNSDAAYLGRKIQREYPFLDIALRKSEADNVAVAM